MWEKTEGGRCGSPGGGKVETPEGGSRLESPEGSVVGARSGHELAHARHAPPGMRKLMPSPRRAGQEPAHARQRACGQQTSKRQGMRHGKQTYQRRCGKQKQGTRHDKQNDQCRGCSAWAGSRQGGWLNLQALWAAVLRVGSRHRAQEGPRQAWPSPNRSSLRRWPLSRALSSCHPLALHRSHRPYPCHPPLRTHPAGSSAPAFHPHPHPPSTRTPKHPSSPLPAPSPSALAASFSSPLQGPSRR